MRRVLAVLLLAACSAAAAEPVGLLTRVSGKVQLWRAGQKTPAEARSFDLLLPGDRIQTADGSEASFLFCPASESGRVVARSEIAVEASGLTALKGSITDRQKTLSCRLPGNLALAEASRQQLGIMRVRGTQLMLLTPCSTNIATLRPSFEWSPLKEAVTYRLTVADREERVLWQGSTSLSKLSYPSDAVVLEWGQKYWWRVRAQKGEETIEEAGSQFRVLPRDQAESVLQSAEEIGRMAGGKDGDRLRRLLLALLYDTNGMLDEAMQAYAAAEDVPWVRARIAELKNMRAGQP